jgi:hypothetical protein
LQTPTRRHADTFPYRRSGSVLSFLRAYLRCKRRLQPLPSESGTISDRTQQLWPQVAPWSHKERFFRTIVPPTVCCRIALLKQTEQNNLKVKRKNLITSSAVLWFRRTLFLWLDGANALYNFILVAPVCVGGALLAAPVGVASDSLQLSHPWANLLCSILRLLGDPRAKPKFRNLESSSRFCGLT